MTCEVKITKKDGVSLRGENELRGYILYKRVGVIEPICGVVWEERGWGI